MCARVLRIINAFLELPADRARANPHIFVEMIACKNSSPNIIVVHASARHRDLHSTPIDAGRTSPDIVKRYRKINTRTLHFYLESHFSRHT